MFERKVEGFPNLWTLWTLDPLLLEFETTKETPQDGSTLLIRESWKVYSSSLLFVQWSKRERRNLTVH